MIYRLSIASLLIFANVLVAAVTIVENTGNPLTNGVNLQTAWTNAQCGDIIVLRAGVAYQSPNSADNPLDTPVIDCRSNFIVTTSDRAGNLVGRVSPADEPNMAILETPHTGPVVRITLGTRGMLFRGLIFTTASTNFAQQRAAPTLFQYASATPNTTGPIWVEQCIFRPYEALAPVSEQRWNPTAFQGILHGDGELRVSQSWFYGFGGRDFSQGLQQVAAATNSTTPVLTVTGHGIGAGSRRTVGISGATGSWTRLNGVSIAVGVDSTTVSWHKWIHLIVVSGNVARIRFSWWTPHYLQTGDSITISGITHDTDLNGTFSVTAVSDYEVTIPTTNVPDGHFCYDQAYGCTQSSAFMYATVDTTGFGSLAGVPGPIYFAAGGGANTYCVYNTSGTSPMRIVENYMDCGFSHIFLAGGNAQWRTTATFSTASPTGGTMSPIHNLQVGDLMAVKTSCTESGDGCYKTVKINTVNPATGIVTYTGFGRSGLANDSGTVTTSGSTVTWASGNTFGCNVASNTIGRWNRGYIITIAGSPYTITTCNSTSVVTVSPAVGTNVTPVSYTLAVTPDVPGEIRYNGYQVAPGSRFLRNTFDKPAKYAHGGFCKAMSELKAAYDILWDGNVIQGTPCLGITISSRSQNAKDPWLVSAKARWTNNLNFSGERGIGIDITDNQTSHFDFTMYPKGGGGVLIENFLSVGHTRYGQPFKADNRTDPSSRFEHITFAYSDSSHPSPGIGGGCSATTRAETPPFGGSFGSYRNNILAFGANGWALQAGGCHAAPSMFEKTVFWDSNGYGNYGANYTLSYRAANLAAVGFIGTCDHVGENWKNCRLAEGSAYKGGATDGGDPGADPEMIEDRIRGWSQDAGLIYRWSGELRTEPWELGSTFARLKFRIYNGIGNCEVRIFTAKSRAIASLHADSGTLGCSRTSSSVSGDTVSFIFGGVSALAANTTYFYVINDGSRKLVGEFKTRPGGSADKVYSFAYDSARSGNICSDAGMSIACSPVSLAARHRVTVPTGAVRYYQATGDAVKVLVAR